MARKLVWGLFGGAAVGAAFGYLTGNLLMGIAICSAAGAIAAGVWHYMEIDSRKAR